MAGEKRSQDHDNAQRQETIVLVDIEGTTTSISFVKDTLFPYVKEHLKDYIEKKWDDAEFKADVEKLKEQAKKDETEKIEGLVAIANEPVEELKNSLLKNVLWQMDTDRKTGALKQLQGHIWRDAYKSGVVKGHVYDDVPKALESWTKNGRKVYVYSSGSVEAQKLLFGHSEHGDMLKYFSGYFDTEVGLKQEASSYKNIISKIGCDASNVIFLTDVAKEAKAAVEAGMASAVVIREGNATLTAEEKTAYPTIKSLLDLSFHVSAKRPKLEETEKEEPKKVEEPKTAAAEPSTPVEDVEMTDVSEKKKEKSDKAVVETEKESKPDNKTTKVTEEIKVEAMETCAAPVEVAKDKEKDCQDVKSTKKVEEIKTAASEASEPETDTKKQETTAVDEKTTELGSKLSCESTSKTTTITTTIESKTEKVEKVEDKTVESKIEPKEETKKAEPEEKKVTEVKDEEVKSEEIKSEPVASKADEKKEPEEKVVIEEKKQNGDSGKTEAPETTSITNGATSAVAEVNGDAKEDKSSAKQVDVKEEKKVDSAKPDIAEAEAPAAESLGDETKATTTTATTEVVEKKLNGSTPSTDKEKTGEKQAHRNGVTDENKQNGEEASSTDKESIKVKKVVESIVDGAGEPEVVPPVAVVAATS